MKTLNLKKAEKSLNLVSSKKSTIEKPIPAFNLNQVELQKMVNEALKPVLLQLQTMEARNLKIQEMTNKLYELIFNSDNSIALLEKLDSIEDQIETMLIQKEAKPEPEPINIDQNKALALMKKYFAGNLGNEKGFLEFIATADFTSAETLKIDFDNYNRQSDSLLCARRSNKTYIEAIAQTHTELNKTQGEATKQTEKINTPVKDFNFWSKELQVDKELIQMVINECSKCDYEISEDNYNVLQQFLMDENNKLTSDAIDKFLEWIETLEN